MKPPTPEQVQQHIDNIKKVITYLESMVEADPVHDNVTFDRNASFAEDHIRGHLLVDEVLPEIYVAYWFKVDIAGCIPAAIPEARTMSGWTNTIEDVFRNSVPWTRPTSTCLSNIRGPRDTAKQAVERLRTYLADPNIALDFCREMRHNGVGVAYAESDRGYRS